MFKKVLGQVFTFAVSWAESPRGKKIEAALFKAVVAWIGVKIGLSLA